MSKIFYCLMAVVFVPAVIFTYSTDVCAKEKHHNWLDEKIEDIREDYDKAIKKIEKSSFNEEQKKFLSQQAAANRDLATTQLQARYEQMTKNREARSGFQDAIRANKDNRKAVKEVDDIL